MQKKKKQQQKTERNQLKTALKTIEIVTRYIQKVMSLLKSIIVDIFNESFYWKHLTLILTNQMRHQVYLRLKTAQHDNFFLIQHRRFQRLSEV